jgi:hypothetical protein
VIEQRVSSTCSLSPAFFLHLYCVHQFPRDLKYSSRLLVSSWFASTCIDNRPGHLVLHGRRDGYHKWACLHRRRWSVYKS